MIYLAKMVPELHICTYKLQIVDYSPRGRSATYVEGVRDEDSFVP